MSLRFCPLSELADRLAKADRKSPIGDSLAEEAVKAWDSIVGDTYAWSSKLRDCSWRRRFLYSPDFRTEALPSGWVDLYADGGIL